MSTCYRSYCRSSRPRAQRTQPRRRTKCLSLIPRSRAEIARILKEEGYITDYELDTTAAHPRIKITNKIVESHERHHRLEAREPARFAPLCRRGGNPARARWDGHRDSLHLARMSCQAARQRSKTWEASCWLSSGNPRAMSRIGNKPVEIPAKVKVNIDGNGAVAVEGPKGKLDWTLPKGIKASVADNEVSLVRDAETRSVKALHGLSRALDQQHGRRRERRFHQAARD